MGVTRKQFVRLAAGTVLAAAGGSIQSLGRQASSSDGIRTKAIVFDAFVLFDARSIAKRLETVFPGRGLELANLWRIRQFEYTWLRTLGQQYVDFWQVTKDALSYVTSNMKLSLSFAQHESLMNAFRELPVWPDVPEALAELHRRGIRMAFLSDLSAELLDTNLKAAKIRDFFEDHLTTDRVQAYKPSTKAYQMGPDVMGLRKDEIVFAAFGAWDAVGAKWFGYPTVWVNRGNVPEEELGVHPDRITPDMSGLLKFAGGVSD